MPAPLTCIMIKDISHIYTIMLSERYPLSVVEGKLALMGLVNSYKPYHSRAIEAKKILNDKLER